MKTKEEILAELPNFYGTLTQQRLKSVLQYSPKTGVFVRKVTKSGNAKEGRVVGVGTDVDYGRIMVDYIRYPAHRLAWLYVHGAWPKGEIDHLNRKRGDNRIINLADVTRSENQQNVTLRKSNTSGFAGVTYFKPQAKWVANIQHNGVRHNLGYFDTPQDASAKYCEAKAQFHTHAPNVQP